MATSLRVAGRARSHISAGCPDPAVAIAQETSGRSPRRPAGRGQGPVNGKISPKRRKWSARPVAVLAAGAGVGDLGRPHAFQPSRLSEPAPGFEPGAFRLQVGSAKSPHLLVCRLTW